jgi:hypothetical protein
MVTKKIPYFIPYFRTFAPIATEDITDQYYFDIILYLTYIEAGTVVKKSEDRVVLRERVGNRILSYLINSHYLSSSVLYTKNDLPAAKRLQASLTQLKAILQIFKDKKFIENYKIEEDALDDEIYLQQCFDQVR